MIYPQNVNNCSVCPLVSVVIPVYNGERFISQAIDSVLCQTYKNIEIIVVDDGSTDNTLQILETYKHLDNVTAIFHEGCVNKGVSSSRQLGVKSATGEYIAFLDADDIFMPRKTEIQVALLTKDPGAVLCHSAIEPICEDGTLGDGSAFYLSDKIYSYVYSKEKYFMKLNRICNSTCLVRSSPLKEIEFAVRQLFQFEDWLLWVMLNDKGKFIYTPNRLVRYTYSKKTSTYNVTKSPLVSIYSHIELYFAMLTKDVDMSIKVKAIARLLTLLRELYREYCVPPS